MKRQRFAPYAGIIRIRFSGYNLRPLFSSHPDITLTITQKVKKGK
jgi:hypothetical protein